MVNFKEIYYFSKFLRGSNIFQGGGPTFSNCLFPIETHITCGFPGGGGPDPLSPPLDPHLDSKGQQEHRQARHICTTTSLTAKGSPI